MASWVSVWILRKRHDLPCFITHLSSIDCSATKRAWNGVSNSLGQGSSRRAVERSVGNDSSARGCIGPFAALPPSSRWVVTGCLECTPVHTGAHLIDLLVPLELITCYKLTRLLRAPVLPRAGSGPVSSISTNRYHPCVQRPCAREIFTYAQNTSCCLAHVSRQRRRSRPWCET